MKYFYSKTKRRTHVTRLQYIFLFSFLLFLLLATTSVLSQEVNYTIKGRVLDENGDPKPKISVKLSPIQDRWEDNTFTDENGRFIINQNHKRGIIRYLFITDGHSFSKNDWAL